MTKKTQASQMVVQTAFGRVTVKPSTMEWLNTGSKRFKKERLAEFERAVSVMAAIKWREGKMMRTV